MDLRCEAKLHGALEDGFLDVKCNSRFCGAGPGVVVIHRFDVTTGELTGTRQFKDPARKASHAAHRTAVRSA